jgi:putative ABC transport system permease protein
MALRPLRVVRRVLALFRWHSRDRDMEREMAFHIDSLARDHARNGLSDVDAQRAARRQFGNLTRLKERGHDERTMHLAEDVVRDVKHGARSLWRSPGFSLAVILTLTLGIGGNTAVFSVVDQLLLRPLPYPDGDQLVMVEEATAGLNSRADVSPANWLDWQRESRTFRRFAAWRPSSFTLTGTGEPRRVNAQLVSSEFFPLLGVAPLLGRTISDEDDRPNGTPVAVLSYRAWQDQLGGDRRAIGRTVQLDDHAYEIVGVMPAGFRFVREDVDLWTAYQLDRNRQWRDTADGRFIHVVGRVADGATIGMARSELEGVARHLAATYAFNRNTSVTVTPLREVLTGQVRTSVLVLFAGVSALLAIACFNAANMLLARSASRQREIAIRASLGAGRWAIARSVLLESLLLAGAGGALGLGLARWSLDALLAVAPTNLLGVSELFIDRRVLIYAFSLSLATGAIAGLASTILFARQSMADALRTRGSKAGHAPRVRQALVVVQVAMTVVLLCGAGVLVRTLIALDRAPTGFDAHDVLTMRVATSPARYPDERPRDFYREALIRLRALPGIESAAVAASLPMIGSPAGGTSFHELGTPERQAGDRPSTVVRMVAPGYFRTLRIPVLRGREFTDADNVNPMAGFVVNEAFARRYLSGRDPLATSISVRTQAENPHLAIIGVVGDVSEGSVRAAPQPTVFYSHGRVPWTTMTLFVRGRQPESLAGPVTAALHELDPALVVSNVRTIESALAESLARERISALISTSFGVGGLLLAALGLYGLLAYLVAERTKDIGIRIALGARLARITGSVVAGGLALVAIGAAVGIAGSLLLLRSLGGLLFGVTPFDVPTYAIVVVLLGGVAALACYVPARRAARIEPLTALRQE